MPSWRGATFDELEQVAVAAGMIDRWERACTAVEAGLTSPAEVRRILGVARPPERFASLARRPRMKAEKKGFAHRSGLFQGT